MGPRVLIEIYRPCFFLVTKKASGLWFGMNIGIYHPYTHNGNTPHILVHMGPRGKYSNIKGLRFLRNQGSHLALVWYVDSF